MTLFLGQPIPLASTSVPLPVPFPDGSSNLVTQVKVANQSGFTVNLFVGGALLDSVTPFIVNVYQLVLDPVAVAGRTPCPPVTYTTVGGSSSTVNTLTPTWGFYGDTFQGNYPVPLPPT